MVRRACYQLTCALSEEQPPPSLIDTSLVSGRAGEVLPYTAIQGEVHPGLVRLFGPARNNSGAAGASTAAGAASGPASTPATVHNALHHSLHHS